MRVTYIIRSPGTGHSLEGIFYGIIDELKHDRHTTPNPVVLPVISKGLRTIWQNMAFVKRISSELTHITGDIHYTALATNPATTLLTIPDCVLLSRTPKWTIRYFLFWLLWYYLPIRRAAVVTAISDKTRRELFRYVGQLATKVVTVPCHYNPAFAYNLKTFNSTCPTILHVGTAPHKNLSRLIEALTAFPCRLVIVGQLTETDRNALQLHQIDYEQHSDISQDQMIRLYEQCDLVSFVSLYEGFGMPVLEGQVVGRPVVTSNISPMTDVGGTGACYVDPTNIADIRRGILRVCQDETYQNELITNGRLNAQQYTIERVTAQYVALYDSLAQSRPTMNTIDQRNA